MNPIEKFERENLRNINLMSKDKKLQRTTSKWFLQSYPYQYSYHFKWLGRPLIQYPQDIIALQEIIWKVKPDLIVETGVAHGGSLILSASMLELIGKGKVIGIDVDIRPHNRREIENHPLYKRIIIFEGSSTDTAIANKVIKFAKNKKTMVILDSDHSYHHVLRELEIYSPLVRKGSYIVVFDTIIYDLPAKLFKNRPWNKKNNPKLAVDRFLKENDRFVIDAHIHNKLLISAAPNGYLKCVKN